MIPAPPQRNVVRLAQQFDGEHEGGRKNEKDGSQNKASSIPHYGTDIGKCSSSTAVFLTLAYVTTTADRRFSAQTASGYHMLRVTCSDYRSSPGCECRAVLRQRLEAYVFN